MEILKRCCKCFTEKTLDNFGRQKNTKDGYKTECKQCAKARDALLYLQKKAKNN